MKKYVLVGAVAILLIISTTVIFIVSQNRKKLTGLDNLFLTGQYDVAIESATNILKNQGDDVEALLLLAATYAQKGSVSFKEEEYAEKAIQYADQALQIDPSNSEAYRIKGYAYEIQEKYALAHENYDQSLVLNSKNTLTLSNKGHAFDLEGNFDKAEELYKTALSIDPNNDHALINLGRLYVRQEKLEDAKFMLNNLLSSKPQLRFEAEAYMILSYIYQLEEEFELALERIDTSIKIDPTLPQAYVQRARLILGSALEAETDAELKQVISAVTADLDAALDINPNQTSAYILFMELQFITGDKSAQKEYQSKAMQAVELDITLGAQEKLDVKRYLNAKVKVIN